MNIGYAMIGGILLDVAINLITLLVTGIIALIVFFKKCCRKKCCNKKSKARYQIEPQTKETEIEFADTNNKSTGKIWMKW